MGNIKIGASTGDDITLTGGDLAITSPIRVFYDEAVNPLEDAYNPILNVSRTSSDMYYVGSTGAGLLFLDTAPIIRRYGTQSNTTSSSILNHCAGYNPAFLKYEANHSYLASSFCVSDMNANFSAISFPHMNIGGENNGAVYLTNSNFLTQIIHNEDNALTNSNFGKSIIFTISDVSTTNDCRYLMVSEPNQKVHIYKRQHGSISCLIPSNPSSMVYSKIRRSLVMANGNVLHCGDGISFSYTDSTLSNKIFVTQLSQTINATAQYQLTPKYILPSNFPNKSGVDTPQALAQLADGSLLCGGGTTIGSLSKQQAYIFKLKGTPTTDAFSNYDSTFTGGAVYSTWNNSTSYNIGDIVVASDNRFYKAQAVGSNDNPTNAGDSNINNWLSIPPIQAGVVRIDFGGGNDYIENIFVQSSQKILVSGRRGAYSSFSEKLVISRLTSIGELDSTFGVGGYVESPITGPTLKLANDKVLVIGQSTGYFRVTANGASDLYVASTPRTTQVVCASEQTDNMILCAGGYGTLTGDGLYPDMSVARYDTSGVLDPAFGFGGEVSINLGGVGHIVRKVVEQADGKILLGCNVKNAGEKIRTVIVRLLSTGVIDAGFGDTGVVTLNLGSDDEQLTDLLIHGGTKIYVISNSGQHMPTVTRLAITDGSIDTTFARADFSTSLYSRVGTITPSSVDAEGEYGSKMASSLNGSTIVVMEPEYKNNTVKVGKLHVYDADINDTWTEIQTIVPPDNDVFGSKSLCISRDASIISVCGKKNVYLYKRNGGTYDRYTLPPPSKAVWDVTHPSEQVVCHHMSWNKNNVVVTRERLEYDVIKSSTKMVQCLFVYELINGVYTMVYHRTNTHEPPLYTLSSILVSPQSEGTNIGQRFGLYDDKGSVTHIRGYSDDITQCYIKKEASATSRLYTSIRGKSSTSYFSNDSDYLISISQDTDGLFSRLVTYNQIITNSGSTYQGDTLFKDGYNYIDVYNNSEFIMHYNTQNSNGFIDINQEFGYNCTISEDGKHVYYTTKNPSLMHHIVRNDQHYDDNINVGFSQYLGIPPQYLSATNEQTKSFTTGMTPDVLFLLPRSQSAEKSIQVFSRNITDIDDKYQSMQFSNVGSDSSKYKLDYMGHDKCTFHVTSAAPSPQNRNIVSGGAMYDCYSVKKKDQVIDVQTYSGGVSTVAHNIGAQPDFIMMKSATNNNSWQIWHKELPSGTILTDKSLVPSTPSEGPYVVPTSSVFTPTDYANVVGQDYFSLILKEDSHNVKVGSYVGSASQITLNGFQSYIKRCAFAMIKNISKNTPWVYLYRTANTSITQYNYIFSGGDPYVPSNQPAIGCALMHCDGTGGNYSPSSAQMNYGLTIFQTNNVNINFNGDTFIYVLLSSGNYF